MKMIKRNPQSAMLVVALSFLLASGIASLLGESTLSFYLQTMYFIVIIPFIIISTRLASKRRQKMDIDTHDFLKKCRNDGQGRVRYFVPSESNHTTINWWRKFRGKHALSMFIGQYSDDSDVRSYRTYLLTEKELFQAKLCGYYDTEDVNIAEKGFLDPRMTGKAVVRGT